MTWPLPALSTSLSAISLFINDASSILIFFLFVLICSVACLFDHVKLASAFRFLNILLPWVTKVPPPEPQVGPFPLSDLRSNAVTSENFP